MAAVFSVIIMGTCAEAAEITVSENKIELEGDRTEFSIELNIEEDELFAGAEFGITLPEGMSLSSVEYLDEDIKNASHTPVVVKNGCAYFGFYSAENVFSGEYNAAKLTFRYEGDDDTEIKLDSSQVVYVEDDGTTSGDKTSAPFTVEILRVDGSGGNGSGSSGGGGGGGTIMRPQTGGTNEENKENEEDKENEENAGGETAGEWVNPFFDVKESDWFYAAVRYANENGLFGGVSETEFAPNMHVTRGMTVTVLYRAEGEPEAGSSAFADVEASAYYADAAAWAEANGIVKGYTETEFGPNDDITREQMAAIMHRYAEYKGVTGIADGDLSVFSDAGSISDWAEADMRWAVGAGIINGRSETIDPLGSATRAETAAILQRFLENN